MTSTQHQGEDFGENEEHYITQDDVLEEITGDGDAPMEEDDDDEAGDIVGDLGGPSGSGEDNSVQSFQKHTSSVFTVSAHPTEHIAASGGEDDLGYIWDIVDGEVIVKLTGHTDSVACTAWSQDGQFIATGGMDGKVRVWRRVGNQDYRTWEFVTELQGPDEVMFLRWHPKGNVLLAGSNDSTLWLWQLPSGNTMQVFAGHTGAVQCGEFTPDGISNIKSKGYTLIILGKRIVSACADGSFIYWDPRSPAPVFKLTADDGRFNLDGITSLGVNAASTLAVVGGAAGGLRVISLSKGEIVTALGGHTDGDSIESIQFLNFFGADNASAGVVATGATDGKICIWDLSTMRIRTTLKHEDAITTLLAVPAPRSHLLVSASADATLRTWDARTGTLVREHKGHQGPVLGASLGLNGTVILSAGDDGVCLVYTTEEADEL